MEPTKTKCESDRADVIDIIDAVKITDAVLGYSVDFFRENGFKQLLPVILSTITDPLGPDPGSSVVKTGEIEYLGQKLVLTQSMILHKQIAVKKGLDKLFVLSPNVRLEHPKRKKTGKHLFEFTQIDFEIAHAKMDDVMIFVEKYLRALFDIIETKYLDVLDKYKRKLPKIEGRLPVFTVKELEAKYGDDWEIKKSKEMDVPFWVISHKREFYDKEDPKHLGEYLNYDLVYPGGFGEALSGAEREHEYERIVERIERDAREGLDASKYAKYLELSREGMTPTAGGGIGVERLVRFIIGARHVGDVQLFRRVPGEKVDV